MQILLLFAFAPAAFAADPSGTCFYQCAEGLAQPYSEACTTDADCKAACNKTCGQGKCQEATAKCSASMNPQNANKPESVAGRYGLRDPLQGANVPDLMGGFVRFLLGFIGALFFGFFIYGGVLWTLSGGEAERVKKARQTLTRAVIGLAIIFFSYMIVSTILSFSSQAVPAPAPVEQAAP